VALFVKWTNKTTSKPTNKTFAGRLLLDTLLARYSIVSARHRRPAARRPHALLTPLGPLEQLYGPLGPTRPTETKTRPETVIWAPQYIYIYIYILSRTRNSQELLRVVHAFPDHAHDVNKTMGVRREHKYIEPRNTTRRWPKSRTNMLDI